MATMCGFKVWVVAALLALAVALGLANNLRVPAERRVPFWGALPALDDDAGVDAGDDDLGTNENQDTDEETRL